MNTSKQNKEAGNKIYKKINTEELKESSSEDKTKKSMNAVLVKCVLL